MCRGVLVKEKHTSSKKTHTFHCVKSTGDRGCEIQNSLRKVSEGSIQEGVGSSRAEIGRQRDLKQCEACRTSFVTVHDSHNREGAKGRGKSSEVCPDRMKMGPPLPHSARLWRSAVLVASSHICSEMMMW